MLAKIWRATPNDLQPQSLRCSGPASNCWVLGLGGGLLAHMLYGLTDAVALGAKPGFMFWMLLGLITGLYSQIRATE